MILGEIRALLCETPDQRRLRHMRHGKMSAAERLRLAAAYKRIGEEGFGDTAGPSMQRIAKDMEQARVK